MARRRYFRYYKRTTPKKKWASNITPGALNTSQTTVALVANSTGSSTPTPVIVKAGNFKIQGDCTISVNSLTAAPLINVYLMFLPEGNTITSTTVTSHPEWVMAWTTLDFPYTGTTGTRYGGNKFSMSSRLKRNLNSGDKIVLHMQSNYPEEFSPVVTYTAQFFTCAN